MLLHTNNISVNAVYVFNDIHLKMQHVPTILLSANQNLSMTSHYLVFLTK